MQTRTLELSRFLRSLRQSLLAQATHGSDARRVTERILHSLQDPAEPATPESCQFPVCGLLDEVVADVVDSGSENNAPIGPAKSVVEHAQAMQSLSGSLAWWQRSDAASVGEPFASGHANATVIGNGGLEERDDVWVGISLVAPNIDYPVHHHAPEEVYLVLSTGCWNQNNGPWHEPGVGGIVHNPPDILHAMRSGDMPLLATWCLWLG